MTEKSTSAPKWCLWEVHRSGAGGDPFYTVLPQYGPWDTERRARQSGEQLQRLEYEDRELAVRELDQSVMLAMPAVLTIKPPASEIERNNEHLRWQSPAQHD